METTEHIIHDIGIANQLGSYSDAVEVGPDRRWLYISGTPGLSPDGDIPNNITGQTAIAWENILKLLTAAGMTVNDIVKVTQYLTSINYISEYSKTRKRYLGDVKPASTLLITPELGLPAMLVEVEMIAAKKP